MAVMDASKTASKKGFAEIVNVSCPDPPGATNWRFDAPEWKDFNYDVGGHPDFTPLTVKGAYVLGVIYSVCECVSALFCTPTFVQHNGYMPAYGIFASAIDLLGRCTSGEEKPYKPCLIPGFNWLAADSFPAYEDNAGNEGTPIIKTTKKEYTADDLKTLRHFILHGQATAVCPSKLADMVDYQILPELATRFPDRLQRWWECLHDSNCGVATVMCQRLAKAAIIPYRNWPILRFWQLLEGTRITGPRDIPQLFSVFCCHWQQVINCMEKPP